jgi:hypothetical protein
VASVPRKHWNASDPPAYCCRIRQIITWDAYFDRIVGLRVQFDMARKALEGFEQSKDALERYATEDLGHLRELIHEGAKEAGKDPHSTWVHDEDAVAKYLDAAKEGAVRSLVNVRARLRQYEYILRVTIFESFMKDTHRAILTAAPSLLKPDRQVPLGKLVSKGLEDIVGEEIEREVQILDRKSTKEKAEYFLERLGIGWFDGTIVPILDGVIDVRNEMLHENPERIVSDIEMVLINLVTTSVPIATIAQAAILYPSAVSLPTLMKEEDARKFLPKQTARKPDPPRAE